MMSCLKSFTANVLHDCNLETAESQEIERPASTHLIALQ